MQEVNAQMVLKLHQLSGEPVANCNYLLTQTNGDYELALKILERILQQRKAEKEQAALPNETSGINAAEEGSAVAAVAEANAPQVTLEALENRVHQLELRFAQLVDTLDSVNGKLGALVDKISGTDQA